MSDSPTSRIVGVDVARCLALLGMMATHVLPSFRPGTTDLTFSQLVAGGRASALFAVLAGVSLALVTGRATPLRGRPLVGAAAGIVVRAVLIGALGLALAELDTRVAVILSYYAVMFVLALPFLTLRTPHLLALAGVWTIGVPVLSHVVRQRLMPSLGEPTFDSLRDLPGLAADLGLTGVYPAVPWMAYVFLGLAIGRADLRARWLPVQLITLGGGVALLAVVVSNVLLRRPDAVAALGRSQPSDELRRRLTEGFFGTTPTDTWWWLGVHAPHSGTPFDLAHTMGCAAAVIGVCLLVGRAAPRIAGVVFGAGAMTLTLYSGHVVLIDELWDDETVRTYLQHAGAALAIGAVFAFLRWRGPLELVVGFASGRVRRLLS